jgi:hypothetical protein
MTSATSYLQTPDTNHHTVISQQIESEDPRVYSISGDQLEDEESEESLLGSAAANSTPIKPLASTVDQTEHHVREIPRALQ